MSEEFQGFKNYETWNVALYIMNERKIYEAAKKFMKDYKKGRSPYIDFVHSNIYFYRYSKTPDGVKWNSNKLFRSELNNMMFDLLD